MESGDKFTPRQHSRPVQRQSTGRRTETQVPGWKFTLEMCTVLYGALYITRIRYGHSYSFLASELFNTSIILEEPKTS